MISLEAFQSRHKELFESYRDHVSYCFNFRSGVMTFKCRTCGHTWMAVHSDRMGVINETLSRHHQQCRVAAVNPIRELAL